MGAQSEKRREMFNSKYRDSVWEPTCKCVVGVWRECGGSVMRVCGVCDGSVVRVLGGSVMGV